MASIKYRKTSLAMWADEKFRNLSRPQPNGQSLWQWFITGPRTTNIPGIVLGTPEELAGSIRWPLEGFMEPFQEVIKKGMAKTDREAGLTWLPNAPEHNKPDNPNVVTSWRTSWEEVPECGLKLEVWRDLKSYAERWGEPYLKAFMNACREPCRERSPKQDQEQEQKQNLLAGLATPTGDSAQTHEQTETPRAAKAPKAPRKPPDPMVATSKDVTDFWSELWRVAQGGSEYLWTKEQAIALQPLIKKLGPGEVKARMVTMIKHTPDGVKSLLKGGPPTVGAFVACINSLAPWSAEKARAAPAAEDDFHRDDGWKQKSGLKFSELGALAQRKVPAWWSLEERIAMKEDVAGETVIPLLPTGVPQNHEHVMTRLREFVEHGNAKRRWSPQLDGDVVIAWYRKRFNVGGA